MSTESESSDNINTNGMPSYRSRGQSWLAEYIPPDQAIELENIIFNYSNEYISCYNLSTDHLKSIYNTKVRDIHYNLNPINSPTLLADILNNRIPLAKVPHLTPNELNPIVWDSIIKKKEYIEYKKNNMATSDAYECRKCKQRKCKVFLLQTRSADEPMTIFVQCEVCNTSFRIYN